MKDHLFFDVILAFYFTIIHLFYNNTLFNKMRPEHRAHS